MAAGLCGDASLARPDGRAGRHHFHEPVIQRSVSLAATEAEIDKRVTCHTFRHALATRLLERGHDIRTVQELLGHRDVSTHDDLYSRPPQRCPQRPKLPRSNVTLRRLSRDIAKSARNCYAAGRGVVGSAVDMESGR